MKGNYAILLTTLILSIYGLNSYAQFVVAQDTIRGRIDFCIRPGDLNNGIVVPNDSVFYMFPPDLEIDPWRYVDFYLPNREVRSGYIRGTDLMRVDDYDIVEVERLSSHGAVSFRSDDVRLNISVASVGTKDPAIQKHPDGSLYINGKRARGVTKWGTPRLRYQSIVVSIKGRTITLPKKLYEHLFEPEIDNMVVYYNPKQQIVYIVTNNGGTSAYYNAMWAVSPRGAANVYVFDPADRR